MGQYHFLVNLDKRQFVHPHRIGNGLKLHEQIGWRYSTSTALVMLLASASNNGGRGGGDFRCLHPLVGSWAGDRIAFIGDYANANDVPYYNAPAIYEAICCDHPLSRGWTDISSEVRTMMAAEFDIRYTGAGWLNIVMGPMPAPPKTPKRKHPVENNPLVEFYYPNSKGYGNIYRLVRVISADRHYIWGLDTGDKNRIKKFSRSRITQWKSVPIDSFNPEAMP